MCLPQIIAFLLPALPGAVFAADNHAASFCESKLTDVDYEQLFQGSKSKHIVLPPHEIKALANFFSGMQFGAGVGYGRNFEEYLRWLREFKPEEFRGKTILDIGCGLSPFVDVMADQFGASAYGIDLIFHKQFGFRSTNAANTSKAILESAKKLGLNLSRRIGASSTNLPFDTSSVDAVVSVVSLPYLPGFAHQQALAEIIRVLRPGGKAYLAGAGQEEASVLKAWGASAAYISGDLVITKGDPKTIHISALKQGSRPYLDNPSELSDY